MSDLSWDGVSIATIEDLSQSPEDNVDLWLDDILSFFAHERSGHDGAPPGISNDFEDHDDHENTDASHFEIQPTLELPKHNSPMNTIWDVPAEITFRNLDKEEFLPAPQAPFGDDALANFVKNATRFEQGNPREHLKPFSNLGIGPRNAYETLEGREDSDSSVDQFFASADMSTFENPHEPTAAKYLGSLPVLQVPNDESYLLSGQVINTSTANVTGDPHIFPPFLSQQGLQIIPPEGWNTNVLSQQGVGNTSVPVCVEEVSPNDYLTGRGGHISRHPGNQRVRKIVVRLLNQYSHKSSSRAKKTVIVNRVIQNVRACGGKFLHRVEGGWVPCDAAECRRKVSQRFREEASGRRNGRQRKSCFWQGPQRRRREANGVPQFH